MNPRRNLINFRLTDEEHDRLKAACAAQGSRTLSEFVRETILRVSATRACQYRAPATVPPGLETKVSEMEAAARRFTNLLGEIAEYVAGEFRQR